MKILQKLGTWCCLLFSLGLLALLLYIMINQTKNINSKADQLNNLEQTSISLLRCTQICRNKYNLYTSEDGDNCCLPLQTTNCYSKDTCKTNTVQLLKVEVKGMQYNVYYESGFLGFLGLLITVFLCYKCAKRRQQGAQREAQANLHQRINSMLGRINNFNQSLIPGSREQLAQSLIASNAGETCAICLQQFEQRKIIKLACNHAFHSRCIGQWIQLNARCPVCRNRQ